MKKILFVCHGNICRSAMAEFMMKDLAAKRGRGETFLIRSAAVSREAIGEPVYGPARRELQKHGIRCDGHAAHQITRAEREEFDHIFYMDESNGRYLTRLFGAEAAKCRKLLRRDVADPWYTGDFAQTWADLVEGCEKIWEELEC